MTLHCLDSDFVIDVLADDAVALKLLGRIEAQGRPSVSVITAFEVTDVPGRRRREVALDALSTLDIIPVDGSISVAASRLSVDLRASGKELPIADLLIGATCLLRGLTLVTRNVKDFRRIPRLDVVTW